MQDASKRRLARRNARRHLQHRADSGRGEDEEEKMLGDVGGAEQPAAFLDVCPDFE
jgi:hypothetical protein